MAKRALVVDDSNAARTLLSRMLEKYEIEVDSAESAEQALEYLGHHRPDVIFMDHMMPGMDGLQAVRTIKNNPRTATIPIMMYTSQEGELYVGQARALGAVGVLPKQIQPTDVSKVLYQLHLLPDRRSNEQSTFRRLDDEEDDAGHRPAPAAKPLTAASLREQFAELRRTLVAMLDSHSERLKIELRSMLEDALSQPLDVAEHPRPAARRGGLVGAIAAIAAVLSLGVAGEQALERRALSQELMELRARVPGRPAQSQSAAPPASATGVREVPRTASAAGSAGAAHRPSTIAKPIIEVVPYGEDPLGGPRLDALRQLFDRLVAQGYHGTVDIRIFPGRFCLIGNTTDGFSLAPDETAYSQCDVVGSVPDDSMPQSQRGSLAFADLAAGLRSASHGAVDVQVETGDEASTLVAYPPVSESLTAGEWNRAGGANNRIEVRLR